MKKLDFNKGWSVRPLGSDDKWKEVTLPHDAMISEKRALESAGIHNIGWFEALDYEYEKEFFVSKEEEDLTHRLVFEGVYHNCDIYINGEHVAFHAYGYTEFSICLDTYLRIGDTNTIKVVARNSDQPNSRWYSGTGIYRPVWMCVSPKEHINLNGIKIKTLSVDPAKILVEVKTSSLGSLDIEILDNEEVVAKASKDTDGKAAINIELKDAKLWSPESPYMYECKVRYKEDETRVPFGIRLLEYGPSHGLTINGKHVILKGACIHHDNGILGACAYKEAEERKIRILKEQGYNAIRSAHNPCSNYLLEACDKMGMLVMDEYVDCWYIHKTKYDYVNFLEDNWKKDLKAMVLKDYNHPSVIMYSTGNEVAETGEKRGIKLTKDFTDYLHMLDDTRPVSCGINIFFNFLYSAGFGVYSDDKADKEAQRKEDKSKETKNSKNAKDDAKKKETKPVGSEFYNTLAGILGDTTMKVGATLPMCDVKTRDAYANMDIAGYNYGILRYKHDLKKYPQRLILGSETFCKDTWKWLEITEKNERIIGDFVWAGQDYIGEAGIGAWEYEQYAPKDADKSGWLTAGSGRVDILGFTGGEAAYTRVVYKAQKEPAIAVKPLCNIGKHSPSAWKLTEAIESWSYKGYEGKEAFIEVYTRDYSVELFLNGRSLGRKKVGKTFRTYYKTPYENGELKAVTYDRDGNKLYENKLVTAADEVKLSIMPEKKTACKDEIIFIPIMYTDGKGIRKPSEMHEVELSVEGGKLLGFGNACSYNKDGYKGNKTFSYYGQMMAAVRAGSGEEVRIRAVDECREEEVIIPITTKK
ncbi:MAG: DUF4982 domain-containing protein [Butyrivibrio sp.]|uniref:glycoside hydrolase family 2 TIM barrel-domain containing protein n=1 Tax=Butyrivibrio sp. TaxID=28121 RepID=UPI0025E46C11|nr:glycoside hydrolase family 2 TIM barrel-domain containing protein [Butyrivibrio sp.]MCR5771119.1 DUF4982 domain-containing protein [Butyrivibrio sp.]